MISESLLSNPSYLVTLKKASHDDTNDEYMVTDTIEVIDFDMIKDEFCKNNILISAKSNDVLYIKDDKYLFIEFKNGNIDIRKTHELKQKNYDSTIILSDILNLSVKDFKEKVNYLLVYRNEKVKISGEKVFDEEKNLYVPAPEAEIVNPIDSIIKKLEEKAEKRIIRFGLES